MPRRKSLIVSSLMHSPTSCYLSTASIQLNDVKAACMGASNIANRPATKELCWAFAQLHPQTVEFGPDRLKLSSQEPHYASLSVAIIRSPWAQVAAAA
jgi:hypothetical protein